MTKIRKHFLVFTLVFVVLLTSFSIFAQGETSDVENNTENSVEIIEDDSDIELHEETKDKEIEITQSEEKESDGTEIEVTHSEEKESAHQEEKIIESNNSIIDLSHTNVSISRFVVYTNPEKSTYLSGEEVLFYSGLSLTDDISSLVDSVLEVSVPKENVVHGTFIASDINSQKSKEVIDEGDSSK